MANKYTRKIDEMFQKYDPEHKADYIYLGYCHKGDEDGGCDDYDYVGWDFYDIEQQEPYKIQEKSLWWQINPDDKELNEAYEKDWDILTGMLRDGFPDAVEADYSSTNCYWYRHYMVNRDHQIISLVTRGDIDGDERTEASLNLVSEEEGEMARDNNTLKEIQKHADELKSLLTQLEHDDSVDKAYAIISTVPNHRNI